MIFTLVHSAINRNAELLEHVIQRVEDPKMLSDFLLTHESQIRFTYDGIRYIVYHRGHVSISEPGVEIGGRPEADVMKKLLGI